MTFTLKLFGRTGIQSTPMSQSSAAAPTTKTPTQVYLVLTIGVIAASCAAIFIRFAQADGMPSPVIAAGRLALSALLLTPFALARHRSDLEQLERRDLLLAAGAGFFLAVHFAAWISSLEYTSVLISVVLVSTSPLWVALLEFIFLRARFERLMIIGLGIALIGGFVIGAAGDPSADVGQMPVLGGGLALLGAIAIAIYLVIGRNLRAKLPLLPYIWLVYGFAALFLIALVIIGGQSITGYAPTTYVWVLVLALVPQLIGHTSFNYALRYLPATLISIAGQMEPLASALLAFVVFQELPAPLQIAGSAAVLVGVIMATLGQAKKA
ncbi:MAG: EamA family transporter [Chloroflexota bacterium]|nr:EamA family transporter [Chloroflexota bacterium]